MNGEIPHFSYGETVGINTLMIMRYFIAILGFLIIIIRIIFPEWKIDEITIILFIFSSILLFLNNQNLSLIKLREFFESIKIGNFIDIKFRDLKNELEQIEDVTKIDTKLVPREFDFLHGSGSVSVETSPVADPNFEIISIGREIENFVSFIWNNSLPNKMKPMSIKKQVSQLNSENIINDQLTSLVYNFWNIRDKVILDHKLSKDKIYGMIDIGYRILNILRAIEAENRPDRKQ